MIRASRVVRTTSAGTGRVPARAWPSAANCAPRPSPGAIRPSICTPTTSPMARIARAQSPATSTPRVPRKEATIACAAASPSCASTSLMVGRKAPVMVPSAAKRRSRLGSR